MLTRYHHRTLCPGWCLAHSRAPHPMNPVYHPCLQLPSSCPYCLELSTLGEVLGVCCRLGVLLAWAWGPCALGPASACECVCRTHYKSSQIQFSLDCPPTLPCHPHSPEPQVRSSPWLGISFPTAQTCETLLWSLSGSLHQQGQMPPALLDSQAPKGQPVCVLLIPLPQR